jgi:hypothetical protein
MIARRVMEDVAAKHGLAVLFHEKPFQVTATLLLHTHTANLLIFYLSGALSLRSVSRSIANGGGIWWASIFWLGSL